MASPVTCGEVPERFAWSNTVVAKLVLVETCRRYAVAPVAAFQLSVGLTLMLVAPSVGDASVGADGAEGVAETVVKLLVEDQLLVPIGFVALTRQ